MYYNGMGYFGYVKKEDAKELLKRRGIMSWVFALAVAIVFGVLHFAVAPRMAELSVEMGVALPLYADPTVRLIVLIVTIIALFSVKPEPESVLDEKLSHYKSGEMILMSKLMNYRHEMMLFAIMLSSIIYIILSVVLPVYSLTASV
ncbi:hypothetical protein HZB58_02720 [Candidatus Gottesmanbacteria bacterium]|nr:hypothetical protein [Candidatus Gottesmanbacteria bacterium]